MALRKRKRKAGDLENAQRSLEHARKQRAEQETKRQQEQERLIKRMERLAEENHLAALVWDVVTGNGGHE